MTSNLMVEYRQWVKNEGHITASADSVLRAFIKAKGYGTKEYAQLVKELGFGSGYYYGDNSLNNRQQRANAFRERTRQ